MAKKKRKPRRSETRPATSAYTDDDGNVLVLRQALSSGTIRKVAEESGAVTGSVDDIWQRRTEILFERLAVSWEIAGLPLDDQKMLIGRYRMADPETRRWVADTIASHVARHIPALDV
jgi:hypothetical protein